MILIMRVRRVGVATLQLYSRFLEIRSKLVLVVGFLFEDFDATKHVSADLLAVVDLERKKKGRNIKRENMTCVSQGAEYANEPFLTCL